MLFPVYKPTMTTRQYRKWHVLAALKLPGAARTGSREASLG